jgi:hypothetical protein
MFFDEFKKVIDVRAGGISHNQARGQVDDLRAVFLHLFGSILDVSTGTPVAGGIAHEFHFPVPVETERPFPRAQGPEAFSSRAGVITIADDDS